METEIQNALFLVITDHDYISILFNSGPCYHRTVKCNHINDGLKKLQYIISGNNLTSAKKMHEIVQA